MMPLKRLKKAHQKNHFFESIEVSKDMLDSIKPKIYRNNKLTTTIDKKQYTMSDIIDLVNKTEKKVSTEMRLLIFKMIL